MPGTSRRSRPEDPPSSATVTMAVMCTSSRTSALSMTCRPCPPPRVTTFGRCVPTGRLLPAEISVNDLDRQGIACQPAAKFLGDRDAAMLAAGAAHREREVPLALALVTTADQVDESDVPVQEFGGTLLGEHVVRDVGVLPGVVAQLRDPMRVGQEPHVDDPVSYTHLRAHETDSYL